MALQIPSGLIVAVSGGGVTSGTTLPVYAYPIPILIVGQASGIASGYHTITDTSGALNVNISGGSVTTSVSGNIILVVSGGAIQVSGSVTTVSGSVSNVSGDVVVVATSGTGAGVVIGASGVTALLCESTAQPNLRVSIWNGGSEQGFSAGGAADNVTPFNDARVLVDQINIFNGTNYNRMRDVIGSSGGAAGVLAVQQVGYSYKNFTGAAITNVKSGAAFLHSVIINSYSSGLTFQIFDSASGATGNSLGIINTDAGTVANVALPPTTLVYDTLMTSGIAVTSSGTNWDVTVTWRTATS